MDTALISRIKNDPAFHELERKRTGFGWTLCIIMLVVYFAFIFAVAFAKGWVATPIAGVVTLAFPLGLGVILLAIVLTGVYVVRANSEFDALTRRIVSNVNGGVAP